MKRESVERFGHATLGGSVREHRNRGMGLRAGCGGRVLRR
jgi:hypothetical protein